jgi:hypothetical protein
MVTGRSPSDPAFVAEWSAFLDKLGALLMAPRPAATAPAVGHKSRRRSA